MKKILLLFLALFVFSNFSLFGQEAQFPLEEVAISDNINVLDSTQRNELSGLCKDFYREKKVQMEVALIPVAWLGSLSLEEYSIELAEKRQLGNKELDSGILILIVGSPEDNIGRGVRIEVGYGLEATLTDVLAKRIIDTYIIPNLKSRKYYQACEQAILQIKSILKDFDSSTQAAEKNNSDNNIQATEEINNENKSKKEEKTEIPWFYFNLLVMIISFLLYGLGLMLPRPYFFTPIVVYPACTALNFLLIHVTMPIVVHIILFFLIAILISYLMLYTIKLRYPQEEDRVLHFNGIGFFMYLFVVVFIMVLGFYYQTLENMYIGFFLGTVISLFASIPLLMLTDIAELEGDVSYSGGGSYSSGGSSNHSSSGGSSYSSGSSSSSGGGGGYSGGGGSFGGGGASGDW